MTESSQDCRNDCEDKQAARCISATELIQIALMAKENAYVPFSRFHVGAALETDDGQIFTGCNIENSSYGASNCAERTAIFKAVSAGARGIRQMAVISDSDDYCYPCGICRQVMAEFATADFAVHVARLDGQYKTYNMDGILPNAFKFSGPASK